MAQNITGRVWFFDAPTAAGDDLNKNGFNRQNVKVGNIIFGGNSAAGDRCIVQDYAGRVIYQDVANQPDDFDRSGKIGWVQGVNIVTLDSGYVMIQMDDK